MKHAVLFLTLIVLLIPGATLQSQEEWATTNGPNSGPVMVVDTTFYVGQGSPAGFWVYSASANHWTQEGFGLPALAGIVSLAHMGDYFYAATGIGVYRSTNRGTLWAQTALNNYDIVSVLVVGDSIFAAVAGGYFLSADSGKTWSTEHLTWPSEVVTSFLLTNNTIYASTDNNLYFSSDRGATWLERDATIKNNSPIGLFAIGTTIFVGSHGHGVYRSTDQGLTWAASDSGIDMTASFGYVYSFAYNGSKLFAAAHANMYVSTNGGDTWRKMGTTGMLGSGPTDVAVAGDYVYAQTNANGPYRLALTQVLGVKQIGKTMPRSIALKQNYPNPFNPSTTISYSLPTAGYASLKIYNTLGEEIATLVDGRQEAGEQSVKFDMGSVNGSIPSGVYFYRISAGNYSMTKSMVFIK